MSEDNRARLREMWNEAEKTGKVVDIGSIVVCDVCNADYTDKKDVGGFIFSGSAYCPKCAVTSLPKIKGYGEERFIKARCPDGVPFSDFVRSYRGKGTIQIKEI